MTETRYGRLQKATAIVPLTLLSAAWTASLMGVGSTVSTAEPPGTLPDGSTMPAHAPELPASVTSDPPDPAVPEQGETLRSRPGTDAGSVRTDLSDTAGDLAPAADTSAIPRVALAAYQRAEAVMGTAARGCDLRWQLLAAIGSVESDHGRHGGSALDADGLARPGIYGIPLDGRRGTTRILDTDGGRLDNDTRYDRAVGPMQFIPSTWSAVGVDGDADGTRDPQDIDDSALASAVYLCAGEESLADEEGLRSAVHRYNRSDAYVDLVLRVMDGYLAGGPTTARVSFGKPADTYPGEKERKGARKTRKTEKEKQATQTSTTRQGPGQGGRTGTRGKGPKPPSGLPPTPKPPKQQPPSTPTQPPSQPPPQPPTSPTPGPTLPATGVDPLDSVLTWAQAQTQCLAEGVPLLDARAMRECVERKLAP